MNSQLWLGLGLPLAGTVLGSALVFVLRGAIPQKTEKAMLGFAAGVMTAASIFSLILPAMEQSGWIPAAAGFLIGIGFLLLLDEIVPHMHVMSEEAEGLATPWSRTTKLFFAITLHNLPEGMAVGVVLAGVLDGSTAMSAAAALALSLGIALQNVPEGAVLSMPLHADGMSKSRAFWFGALSGVIEPVGAGLTILCRSWIQPFLPWLLAFAAGAMLYVVVEELVPQSQAGKHSNIGTVAFALGFAAMMVLDSAL